MVTAGLHENRKFVLMTRYYSEKEAESKLLQVPYRCMMITREGVELMLSAADELWDLCIQMQFGLPINHKVRLHDNMYVVLDGKCNTCHIRRYFQTKPSGEPRPTRMGITIRPQELSALIRILP